MLVNIVFAYADPITQRFRQRRALKVYFLVTMQMRKIQLWQHLFLQSMSHSGRQMGHYALFSVLFVLTAMDSVRNTSAVTAVTKSFMKPWHGTTTHRHLCSYGERKRTQRRNKNDKDNTMMHALQLLQLVKRHISGWSDENQWWNQACSLSHSELRLSQGINQSIRKF